MFRKSRLFVHCAALFIALALLVSGCGGGGAPNGGAVTDPEQGGSSPGQGGGSPGQGGSPSQGDQSDPDDGGQASQPGSGDDDAELFDLTAWGLLDTYEVISRFQKLEFEMTTPLDEMEWGLIHINYNGTADHAGTTVDRYQIRIAGPSDFEEVDDLIEFWFSPTGALVGVRDLNEPDPVLITEPAALAVMQMHTGWMIWPFQAGQVVLAEADETELTITNTTHAVETVLGQRVSVATLEGTARDEDGMISPFTMRVALIGGLPFALEISGGPEPMFITPTAVELR